VPGSGRSGQWGWHRLDPEAADRLVADAGLRPGALVLDIGAGDGVITDRLLAAGCRVVAIELHPDRAARLRRAHDADGVTVVRADAADLRLPRRPFHVVANPPFAVTAPLMRRLLHPGSRLLTAHLVLQDQVARRWASRDAPGRRRWATSHDVTVGRRIGRRHFSPPPRVDARVLHITARRARVSTAATRPTDSVR
jgi:23S rRNA (adenine-N6)-dimethyltransferase